MITPLWLPPSTCRSFGSIMQVIVWLAQRPVHSLSATRLDSVKLYMAVDLTAFVCFSPLKVIYNTLSPLFLSFWSSFVFWSSFPKREAGNVWCYPPAVLESQGYRLIPLSISSLVLLVLPNPFALSVLSFFCWWPILWAFPSEGFIHYIYILTPICILYTHTLSTNHSTSPQVFHILPFDNPTTS